MGPFSASARSCRTPSKRKIKICCACLLEMFCRHKDWKLNERSTSMKNLSLVLFTKMKHLWRNIKQADSQIIFQCTLSDGLFFSYPNLTALKNCVYRVRIWQTKVKFSKLSEWVLDANFLHWSKNNRGKCCWASVEVNSHFPIQWCL